MQPHLIASIYAPPHDPSAREAIAKELDRLLLIFSNFVWAGDVNCAVQQIDTTAVTQNVWPCLRQHVLIDGDLKDSCCMFHPDSKSYTRYPNNIHSSQVRNDYILSQRTFLPTSEYPSIVHPSSKTKHPTISPWTLMRSYPSPL